MVDFMLITMSYILILKTVLVIASQKEQLKVLNTSVSHICTVLIVSLAIIYCFVRHVSPLFNVIKSLQEMSFLIIISKNNDKADVQG